MANTGREGRKAGSRQAAWEFFGLELKARREAAGLTQGELGRRVFVSGGYIGQFEQAIRKPQKDVAARIDEILQTDGFFERMWKKLIADSPYTEYFAYVAELEQLATKICEYAPAVVPGLLQTAEYARAVYLASNPLASDEYIEDMVRVRTDRAAVLKDAARPVYWVVLHEATLRIQVGEPAVMAGQLDCIVAMACERKVLVQVLPFSAGAHPQMGKLLTLMEFADAPPTAYTEGVLSGNLLDNPAVVRRAQGDYDLLRATALSPETSLAMIDSVAEDYRRCVRTT
ncbi:helix-turn-helix transcriptional regulator [Streptomyces sp. FIT100]|uniref:helix-turn-helix domain-containing protein n=1 Tax=Streptomyces sp. FIT100 TaxID=2837956 RepID=UPI0021C80E1D|nr:helix-turn-helix transcriptional regulator [Streptomyces sp. FIT100]UUN26825.1 helix-turn-helix domain-containing protein [Streptomyces sp. FIT100]